MFSQTGLVTAFGDSWVLVLH